MHLSLVNLWKIQTDPRVWTDPMEFKSERFITTHKDVDVRGQQFELMPFGSGRRADDVDIQNKLLRFNRWRPAKLAPTEAKGAWPIFGHLPLLGGSTPPHITLAAMADQYGSLFTIRLGVHPSLVISSSEIAKECFTTNDLVLNSRPKLAVGNHIGYNC
ncbi:unnamed protein product [Prunus armeniaca]